MRQNKSDHTCKKKRVGNGLTADDIDRILDAAFDATFGRNGWRF